MKNQSNSTVEKEPNNHAIYYLTSGYFLLKILLFLVVFGGMLQGAWAIEPDTVWTRNIPGGCYYAQLSSTGDTIMNTAGIKIQLRETATGNLLKEWVGLDSVEIKSAFWSKSGKFLAVCRYINNINLFNVKTGDVYSIKLHNITDETVWINNVVISSDERHLAAVVDVAKPQLNGTRAIHVWDLSNDSSIFYREVNGIEMKYSDDGKYFVFPENITGDLTNPKFLLKLYDAINYKYIAEIGVKDQAQYWITDIKFNSDCNLIATSSDDGTVKIWDVDKRTLLYTYSVKPTDARCVEFIENTDKIIIASGPVNVEIWDYKLNSIAYQYHFEYKGNVAMNLNRVNGKTLFHDTETLSLLTDYLKLGGLDFKRNIDTIIYPNPTTGILKININTPSIKVQSYQIINLEGKQILKGTFNCNETPCEVTIDVSSLLQGSYFLQIDGKSYKLIIAK